ncbi:hypothetical protein [Actinomadura alba]|uniref:Uncharacterized protein n=1 Tax=Actinomadura alba TaxID=406431 RepID=A0ABR7LWE5_9ACTN|nr:hypothetical protein [Actinomadura alba]MBC6469101.1 hypothetical protein [Actinomadura alba]
MADATTGTSDEQDAASHLKALAKLMVERGFTALLVQAEDSPPLLRVTNPSASDLAEDVRCSLALGELCFMWSWERPIAPVRHVEPAAERIAYVLSPKSVL